MKQLIALIITILLATTVVAQKTVHVREYRRKDGTVVKAHDRHAPRSSSSTSAPQIDYQETPAEPNPLDELSRLVLGGEPYGVVDLGKGSFYTPGGTGTTRPRRVFPRIKH